MRLNTDSTLRAIIDPGGDSTRFTYHASMPYPLNNRTTTLKEVYDRDSLRTLLFTYAGNMSSLWQIDRRGIQVHTSGGDTNSTGSAMQFRDWRPAATVWGWLTSPTALAAPARVDTIHGQVSDWGSHWTTTRHDRWGQVLELIHQVDNYTTDTTKIFRTGLFPDSVRSPMGRVDKFGYDLFGSVRKMVWGKPADRDTTYVGYDAFGQVSLIDGPGQATQVIHRSGNPAKVDSVVVAGTYATRYEYDVLGRTTKVKDQKQHETQLFYEPNFGNATKVLYPGARFDSVLFDGYGRDSVVVGSGSARRFYFYDRINRLIRDSSNVDTTATTYEYNRKYLVRVVDPKGQVFKREVNEFGWTRKVYDPADPTRYSRYEYTVEGLPAFFVNERGHWKEMTYWGDYLHRMTGQSTDSNFNVAGYAYGYRKDAPGQPTKRTGAFIAGSNRMVTDSIWMDVRGRVDSVITRILANTSAGLGSSIGLRRFVRRYTWNNDDLPQTINIEARQANTGGLIRSFTPRSFNWNSNTLALDGVSVGAMSLAITPNSEGLDSVWSYPAGSQRSFYRTQRHEVWASTYAIPSVDAALGRAYAYADTIPGQLAQMSWMSGGDKIIRDFRYDAHGRLGRMSDGTTVPAQCNPPSLTDSEVDGWLCEPETITPSRILGFQYDRAGNLRKQVDSLASASDTAAYSTGNRLTSWRGRTYTYDLDGNIASRTDSGGTVNFVYGGDGLLRKAIAGTDTTCYEYDAFGRLAFRGRDCSRNTQPQVTARRVDRIFIWDGDHIIAETDSTGTKRFAEYAYMPGMDRPIALVTDSVPGSGSLTRFYHQDELGNVIGLTRGNTVDQQIAYDAWGETTSITGTVADTNRLRWKGMFWEGGNTRLYYVRNRWYDPDARRFTSQDPLGLEGGPNQYAFGGNDPIDFADPFGLDKCKEGAGPGWTDVYIEDSGWWCYKKGGGQNLPPVRITGAPRGPDYRGAWGSQPGLNFAGIGPGHQADGGVGSSQSESTDISQRTTDRCFAENTAWLGSDNALVAGTVGGIAGTAITAAGALAKAQGSQWVTEGSVSLDLFFGVRNASSSLIESGIQVLNQGKSYVSLGSGLLRGGVFSLVGQAGLVGSYLAASYAICKINPEY